MSNEQRQKAEELKKLLEQVPASGSFESVKIAERIKTLAREVWAKDSVHHSEGAPTLTH
jgi:hypothetical protein